MASEPGERISCREDSGSTGNPDLHRADKSQHCCAVFHELRRFQKEELFCDVNVSTDGTMGTVKAHRVVVMTAESFDSDHADAESVTALGETTLPVVSLVDEAAFEEAYASDDEIDQATEQMQHINALRQKGECCDVTLQASGKQCKAHRCVLAASSEYFKIMFTARMKERSMKLINIKFNGQVDDLYFCDVMDYIYTGDIHLHEENIVPVLCLSSFFQIASLTKLCQNYLIFQLSNSTCCDLYVFSKCFALEELKSASRKFMHDHFHQIEGACDGIHLLETADLTELLRSDGLGKGCAWSDRNESKVLSNVMEWLLHSKFQGVNELLQHVRFALIHRDDIEPHLEIIGRRTMIDDANTDVEEVACAQRFLRKALEYHQNLYEQPLLQGRNTRLRATVDTRICVDGVLAPEAVQLSAMCVSARSSKGYVAYKSWDPVHSVVVLNGFIYVLGGTRQTAVGFSSEVARYDPRLGVWTPVASMNQERGDFFACAMGDFVYVFGGRNKNGPMSTCERYNPRINQWDRIRSMPQPLYQTAGVVSNGTAYVTGGFNKKEAVGITLKYDQSMDRWDDSPGSLLANRGYHVLVDDGSGCLWAIGGVDNPFAGRNVWEVEKFDLQNETWQYIGEVMAVQPFLSVQRLNAFLDENGCVCVSNVDSCPMLRYNLRENVSEIAAEPPGLFELNIQ